MVDSNNKTQQDEGRGQPEPGMRPTSNKEEVDTDKFREQFSEIFGADNLPGLGTGS